MGESRALRQFYYDSDYYTLKLEEVVKTDQEIFEETIYKLSRKELPEQLIRSGLSNFGKTIHGAGFAFLSLDLSSKEVYSLKGIEKYVHLQTVNISNNKITDLEPLNGLNVLIQIDASHNLISNLKHFKPAEVLVSLKLGFNRLTKIPDMSEYTYLRHLEVNDNMVSKIEGIETNKNLRVKSHLTQVLNLANNAIDEIENLEGLDLYEVNLEGNKIETIFGMRGQKNLLTLNLARNRIRKLEELQHLSSLRNLDLSANHIRNLKELNSLQGIVHLTSLDLSYNLCQKVKFYKQIIAHKLPQVRELDGMPITPQDYVKAEIFYGGDVEAKRQIFDSILPEEEFIDRRIFTSHMLDPDSDQEPAEYDFFDKYDEEGNKIDQPPSYLPPGRAYPFGSGRRGVEPMPTIVNLEFVAQSVDYMREQILNYLQQKNGQEDPGATVSDTQNHH